MNDVNKLVCSGIRSFSFQSSLYFGDRTIFRPCFRNYWCIQMKFLQLEVVLSLIFCVNLSFLSIYSLLALVLILSSIISGSYVFFFFLLILVVFSPIEYYDK
jgi:hypothetical protein